MRDRFVVGLTDARLSEQLCRNSKLSLKQAWARARQWEDAEKEKAAIAAAEGFLPVQLGAAKAQKAPRRPDARQRYAPLKTEPASDVRRILAQNAQHVRPSAIFADRKHISLRSVVPVKQKRPSSPLSTCTLSSHLSTLSTWTSR